MELTPSFLALLLHFDPVFTAPPSRPSSRSSRLGLLSATPLHHRKFIFSGGHVGDGHWSRFHRFFSHAAWDLDAFALKLAKLVVSILARAHTPLGRGRHPLSPTRLTLHGAGMHYDPLISSRKKPLVSWGHDWVVLCILIVHPFWAPPRSSPCPGRRGSTATDRDSRRGKRPGQSQEAQGRSQEAASLMSSTASSGGCDGWDRPWASWL